MYEQNKIYYNMKHIFTSLLIFFSFLSFSQVITFECDNQIITVSVDEISNNPNTYIDWDGDGDIDEDDALIYLFEAYDCNDEDNNSNDDTDIFVDYDEENDWGDVFTFECNGEEITIELTNINDFINYESYIDSILSDYDCEEWLDNEENDWGGDDNEENDWNISDIDWNVSDWEDFNWDIYWDEFDLNDIDWENIIWDIIIELDISPEDFIDYITYIIAEGQPFNWDDFFNAQGCIDDDAAIVGGLSGIGIEVAGCSDAVPYLMSIGYSCSDQLTIPGLGSIMPSDVCCETCEGSSGGEDDVMGCTDSSACNYNIEATVNDDSCEYGVQCIVSPCSVSENPGVDGAYCVDDYCNWGSCCALWYDFSGNLISNSCEAEEGCVDDDAAAVALASMWNPDISGCEDAIPYLQAAGYPCDTDLSVLGMSGTIADICECTCDEFQVFIPGCTDMNACNYNSQATEEDGTCGLIDDCGDCQVPYCYDIITNTVEFIPEIDCVSSNLWIGNDCENNNYCLSSPENLYWNSACVSINEYQSMSGRFIIKDLLGRTLSGPSLNIPVLYIYDNQIEKKILIN